MNLTFGTKMSSVKKPLLFSHEHIVSRKRTCILLHTLSTHLCLYLSIHVIPNHFTAKVTNFTKSLKFSCFNVKSRVTKSFSKVDFLSFYSHSTWKTTKKKIHDFGENVYILMYFTSFYLGAGTMQHPMYYCNRLGIWGYILKVGTLILELDFCVFRSTAFWLLSPKNYTIYVFFFFS